MAAGDSGPWSLHANERVAETPKHKHQQKLMQGGLGPSAPLWSPGALKEAVSVPRTLDRELVLLHNHFEPCFPFK